MQEISIHVAGQNFRIRSDADHDYVRELAKEVDSRFKAVKGGRPEQDVKALAMVAIALLDELNIEKKSHDGDLDKTRQFSKRLIARIDELLTQDMP